MIVVNKATYGGVDVTTRLKSFIKNGQLRVKASNDIFGDLAPGVYKSLVVDYEGGTKSVGEGGYLVLPESAVNKLGIFYTNNNVENVVRESLMELQKFKGVADILTCVWSPIPGNPFYETTAMTKSSNHLNIIIQILQLLYTAKESGNYKYVSFLEHDVLYPEGYFDYPDFKTGILTNMNYKGICSTGFQKRNAAHEPLHQMTMIFTEALSHFENLLKEAISKGGVLLEPDANRLRWNCNNPAVHINHGKHFTSHFSIYSSTGEPNDSYWGDASKWIDKLFK
jgi:hypothetical protein